MLGSACRRARVEGGLEGSGNGVPYAKTRGGAFLPLPLVREGCFIFRGSGEKWYGGEGSTER